MSEPEPVVSLLCSVSSDDWVSEEVEFVEPLVLDCDFEPEAPSEFSDSDEVELVSCEDSESDSVLVEFVASGIEEVLLT